MRLVRTKNQGHDNGSINAGDDVLVHGCVASGSPIHEILAASGIIRDCVTFHEFDDARTGSILFEFYRSSGAGKSGLFDRCYAKGLPTGTIKAFGGHVASPSDETNFASMTVRDSFADNADVYFDNTMIASVERLKVVDGQLRWLSRSASGEATWIDPLLIGTGARGAGVASGSSAASVINIEGLRALGTAAFANGILAGMYNAALSKCVIVIRTDDATSFLRSTNASAVYLGAEQCVFEYDGIGTANFVRLTGVALLPDTDNNVYSGWGGWTVHDGGTVTYATLAELQAATGIDLNSLAVDRSATLDPDIIGTTAFFTGTGWTTDGSGEWTQDGSGNGTTGRLQFTASAADFEIRFTIGGAGTLTLRQGGTVIASTLPAGSYIYRAPVVANINWLPTGTACTISDISARAIPDGLKNPVYVQDPENGDWTIVGDIGATGAGLERPGITYLEGPASLETAEAWILARVPR